MPARHESFHGHSAGLSCRFHGAVRLSRHFHVGVGPSCHFFGVGHEWVTGWSERRSNATSKSREGSIYGSYLQFSEQYF